MGTRNLITAAAVVAATAAALFAAPAQADVSVHLSLGNPGYYGQPYGYAQPSYVYTQPSYVYTQPSHVYTQPAYGYSQPYVVVQPRHRGHGARRDRDGDGVPNRFDRRPNNPYRY